MRELLVGVVALILSGLAVPAVAQETNDSWCRASLVRVTGRGALAALGTIEPLVANDAGSPCAHDSVGAPGLTIPLGAGGVTVEVLRASTTTKPTGSAAANIARVVIRNPSTGAPLVTAAVLSSSATAFCDAPDPSDLSGSTAVLGLEVLGVPVSVPNGSLSQDLPGLGTLVVNNQLTVVNDPDAGGGTSHTVQTLRWNSPLVEVVVAESRVACPPSTP